MDWLKRIQNPPAVPAMVIGSPSELRNQLVNYLIQNGFEPEVHDGHAQAAASLRAHKQARTLPAFIISGYQCGSGMNAAGFLAEKADLRVPFIGISADVHQRNALRRHNPELCISEADLTTLIDPKNASRAASSEFVLLLEIFRSRYLDAWKEQIDRR